MAAFGRTASNDNTSKFQLIAQKFSSLVYGRSEGDRQIVNALLDDVNALDFSRTVITNVDVSTCGEVRFPCVYYDIS